GHESSADRSRRGERGSSRARSRFRAEIAGKSRILRRRGPRVCGIIGYVGSRPCKDLLIHGLERLEYRGYDSAGLALLEQNGLDYVRAVGNLQYLKEAAGSNGSQSTTALGHTRGATHVPA